MLAESSSTLSSQTSQFDDNISDRFCSFNDDDDDDRNNNHHNINGYQSQSNDKKIRKRKRISSSSSSTSSSSYSTNSTPRNQLHSFADQSLNSNYNSSNQFTLFDDSAYSSQNIFQPLQINTSFTSNSLSNYTDNLSDDNDENYYGLASYCSNLPKSDCQESSPDTIHEKKDSELPTIKCKPSKSSKSKSKPHNIITKSNSKPQASIKKTKSTMSTISLSNDSKSTNIKPPIVIKTNQKPTRKRKNIQTGRSVVDAKKTKDSNRKNMTKVEKLAPTRVKDMLAKQNKKRDIFKQNWINLFQSPSSASSIWDGTSENSFFKHKHPNSTDKTSYSSSPINQKIKLISEFEVSCQLTNEFCQKIDNISLVNKSNQSKIEEKVREKDTDSDSWEFPSDDIIGYDKKDDFYFMDDEEFRPNNNYFGLENDNEELGSSNSESDSSATIPLVDNTYCYLSELQNDDLNKSSEPIKNDLKPIEPIKIKNDPILLNQNKYEQTNLTDWYKRISDKLNQGEELSVVEFAKFAHVDIREAEKKIYDRYCLMRPNAMRFLACDYAQKWESKRDTKSDIHLIPINFLQELFHRGLYCLGLEKKAISESLVSGLNSPISTSEYRKVRDEYALSLRRARNGLSILDQLFQQCSQIHMQTSSITSSADASSLIQTTRKWRHIIYYLCLQAKAVFIVKEFQYNTYANDISSSSSTSSSNNIEKSSPSSVNNCNNVINKGNNSSTSSLLTINGNNPKKPSVNSTVNTNNIESDENDEYFNSETNEQIQFFNSIHESAIKQFSLFPSTQTSISTAANKKPDEHEDHNFPISVPCNIDFSPPQSHDSGIASSISTNQSNSSHSCSSNQYSASISSQSNMLPPLCAVMFRIDEYISSSNQFIATDPRTIELHKAISHRAHTEPSPNSNKAMIRFISYFQEALKLFEESNDFTIALQTILSTLYATKS